MRAKRFVASFLIVFTLFYSSIFTPIQTARAFVPLLLALTAEELAAAGTLLIAYGAAYVNRDAPPRIIF